jgi:hypothetical protein
MEMVSGLVLGREKNKLPTVKVLEVLQTVLPLPCDEQNYHDGLKHDLTT